MFEIYLKYFKEHHKVNLKELAEKTLTSLGKGTFFKKYKIEDIVRYPIDVLEEGMKVEAEHTENPYFQIRIALDHFAEKNDIKYYKKLKKIEEAKRVDSEKTLIIIDFDNTLCLQDGYIPQRLNNPRLNVPIVEIIEQAKKNPLIDLVIMTGRPPAEKSVIEEYLNRHNLQLPIFCMKTSRPYEKGNFIRDVFMNKYVSIYMFDDQALYLQYAKTVVPNIHTFQVRGDKISNY